VMHGKLLQNKVTTAVGNSQGQVLEDILSRLGQVPAANFARSRLKQVSGEVPLCRYGVYGGSPSRAGTCGTGLVSARTIEGASIESSPNGSSTTDASSGEEAVPTWAHLASMGLDWGGVAGLKATSSALYEKALALVRRKKSRRKRKVKHGVTEVVRGVLHNRDGLQHCHLVWGPKETP
jgi:hypothetical protein